MKKAHLAAGFVAIALFAWVLAHLGVSTLVEQLKAMRIVLPIVLALSLLRLLLQSIAWSASLKGEDVSVDIPKLAGARLAGQSMGYLTFLGPLISQPLKIKLLGTSTEPTVTATFLDNGVYWFTCALLAITGIASLPFVAVHGTTYHLIPGILALAVMVFVITRRNPILSGLVRTLGKKVPSWLARAEQFESSIRGYRVNQPALVRHMFWIDFACQVLIASEVVVVLWALHLSIHFFTILVIEGVTSGMKMLSGWIPARLGSDEGGAISAFALTGFSPMLGLALALTRRVRDLLWALIGIVWLGLNSRETKRPQDTAQTIPTILADEVL
jgi:Lysylphosphatidylglycerol synthase TM region